MDHLCKLAIAAAIVVAALRVGVSAEDSEAQDAADVWALEQAIYERRAGGDTRFYSDISSTRYLGWPAPADEPVPYETIRGFATSGEFQPGEIIDVVSDGITIDGDTAISYFSTHRTVRPGGQSVDERYENIHVFVRRDDGWRLLGAMSRRVLPAELREIPLGEPEAD